MSGWGYRVCSGCGQNLGSDEYSTNQWCNRPVGVSRCCLCVKEGVERDTYGHETARCNLRVSSIHVDLNRVVAVGSFRNCCFGTYQGGPRHGQCCVVKYYQNRFKHLDTGSNIDAVNEKTLHLMTSWNQAGLVGPKFRLNMPEQWTIDGKPCLVEPFIEDFCKFNSNNGWTINSREPMILMIQAFSHYTYHVSSGQFLVCDMQGGVYRDGVILTDPVVLSRNHRFGVTDLGPRGMSTFFHYHDCNEYCDSSWTSPRDQNNYFSYSIHTSIQDEYIQQHPPTMSTYLNNNMYDDESDDE